MKRASDSLANDSWACWIPALTLARLHGFIHSTPTANNLLCTSSDIYIYIKQTMLQSLGEAVEQHARVFDALTDPHHCSQQLKRYRREKGWHGLRANVPCASYTHVSLSKLLLAKFAALYTLLFGPKTSAAMPSVMGTAGKSMPTAHCPSATIISL